LKHIIAELDRIAQYIEEIDEPWAINLVWRIDKVSQTLEEVGSKSYKFSKISKNVLNQYKDTLLFLSENESNLNNLIRKSNLKSAEKIYSNLKENFGNLDKKDSIKYIKNVLKNLNT